MPTRKKMSATELSAEAVAKVEPAAKAAPRRRVAKKSDTPETAPESKKAESKSKPKSPAATHKAGAKRPAVEGKKAAGKASFSVEAHRAEIEREAYFLFANRGFRHGRHADDWHQAIEIVRARYQQD